MNPSTSPTIGTNPNGTAPLHTSALTLGDVVRRSEKAAFTNDVQLGWYPDDARNVDLTRGYIFTSQSVGHTQTSISIFERVRDGFLSAFNPNRHVVVATYGHGKSHLALAMANFFGRASESVEVEHLLDGLQHVAPGKAAMFRDFKRGRGPCLVLRLRGDRAQSLAQQVVSGLEAALNEHEATRGARLGFWFEAAVAALDRMQEAQRETVEAFLKTQQMDVAGLRAKLDERDPTYHELCLRAFETAVGFRPDFGGTVELQTLIERTADDWCGEGKPFSGLLILFDEFSAFIKKYAASHAISTGSPLQNLLDGVHNRAGKVVFVAFSQYEPELTARLVFRHLGAGDDELDSLIKELNRLEREQHYQLYSAMELVLDAYLQQDKAAWESLLDNERVANAVFDASNVVLRLFPERYAASQGWGDEKVHEVLAQGCFPLHPLTTAILCSTKLREVTDPRGVLGFVLAQLDARQGEPAVRDGVPNWVYATALLDDASGFGEALTEDEDEWRQYQNAVRTSRADVADASASHLPILRAMLLHQSAKLKVGRGDDEYPKNIAFLSGLTKTACKTALKELADGGFIRPPSDGSGIYTFWPLGEDGSKVERALRGEVEAVMRDPQRLRVHLEAAAEKWGWDDTEVGHPAGNPADWAAESWLLPRPLFTVEKIRAIVQGYRLSNSKGVVEAKRGYILRPVSASEEDAQWLRASAATLLDEALKEFGEAPPPVVVALPSRPQPNLLGLLVRYQVLDEWKRDRNQVKEVGEQAFNEAHKRAGDEIGKALEELSKSSDFVVPRDYRNAIEARRIEGQRRSVETVLSDLYTAAYRTSVPGFFQQYKRDNSNLRDAVMMACRGLAKNSMRGFDEAAQNKGHARDLRTQFLSGGSRLHWGVLGMDGRVREPEDSRVREAWKVLDDAIPPGADEVPVCHALLRLFNAPFGYDYNTLSLLFSAWFGANAHALKLTNVTGRTMSLDDCLPPKTDPKTFINALCYVQDVRLVRRDDEGWNVKIDAILKRERLKEPFTSEEAETAIAELREYSGDESADPTKAKSATTAAERLEADLKRAQEYETFIEKLRSDTQSVTQMDAALKMLASTTAAPPLGVVTPSSGTPLEELREAARGRLAQIVEAVCVKQEKLDSIRSYDLQKERLNVVRKRLQEAGEPALTGRVDTALSNLDEREGELANEGQDSEFVARLKSLRRETKLAELREGRRAIEEYTPHVGSTQTLMDEVLAGVQSSIEEAESAIADWETRWPQAATLAEVRRLSNEVQKRLERYESTPEYDRLDALLKRGEALEKYFDKLAELRRERPGSTKDLDRLGKRLEALAGDEELSDAQKALSEAVRAHLEERVQQDVDEAVDWLEDAERRQEAGEDAVKLMNDLEKGRTFLPDEYSARLKASRKAVQKRIDDDELKRVEASFRKIKDKAKRSECLKILQAIVNEA